MIQHALDEDSSEAFDGVSRGREFISIDPLGGTRGAANGLFLLDKRLEVAIWLVNGDDILCMGGLCATDSRRCRVPS